MQGNQATWCDALFCKMDQFHKKRYFLLDPTLRALIQVPGAGDNDQVGTLSTNWSGQCSHRESAHYPSREDIAVQFVKYKGRVGASLVMSDPPRSFAFQGSQGWQAPVRFEAEHQQKRLTMSNALIGLFGSVRPVAGCLRRQLRNNADGCSVLVGGSIQPCGHCACHLFIFQVRSCSFFE